MTLNDLEWLFRLKFCFRAVPAASDRMKISKNNCAKTNNDRRITPTTQIFGRDTSFWQDKVCARGGFNGRPLVQ